MQFSFLLQVRGCLKDTAKRNGYKECTCGSSQSVLETHERSGININRMPQPAFGGMMPPMMPPFAGGMPGGMGIAGRAVNRGGYPPQPAYFPGVGNVLGGGGFNNGRNNRNYDNKRSRTSGK